MHLLFSWKSDIWITDLFRAVLGEKQKTREASGSRGFFDICLFSGNWEEIIRGEARTSGTKPDGHPHRALLLAALRRGFRYDRLQVSHG
jgi:hypothetical protein